MKIAILGSGMVGKAHARRLAALGHSVVLGDISTARGSEMYLPLWLRLMGALGTPMFNIAIIK